MFQNTTLYAPLCHETTYNQMVSRTIPFCNTRLLEQGCSNIKQHRCAHAAEEQAFVDRGNRPAGSRTRMSAGRSTDRAPVGSRPIGASPDRQSGGRLSFFRAVFPTIGPSWAGTDSNRRVAMRRHSGTVAALPHRQGQTSGASPVLPVGDTLRGQTRVIHSIPELPARSRPSRSRTGSHARVSRSHSGTGSILAP